MENFKKAVDNFQRLAHCNGCVTLLLVSEIADRIQVLCGRCERSECKNERLPEPIPSQPPVDSLPRVYY